MTCPVYACTVVYTVQVTLYKVPDRKTWPFLSSRDECILYIIEGRAPKWDSFCEYGKLLSGSESNSGLKSGYFKQHSMCLDLKSQTRYQKRKIVQYYFYSLYDVKLIRKTCFFLWILWIYALWSRIQEAYGLSGSGWTV